MKRAYSYLFYFLEKNIWFINSGINKKGIEQMKIDKIYCSYYNAALNKYIVLARVRRGTDYVWRRIPFNDKEEADNLKVGDYIYE